MAELLTREELAEMGNGAKPKVSNSSDSASTVKPITAKAPRMRLSADKELILLKKVVAYNANVGTYGHVQKKFEIAAQEMNANPNFRFQVKAHTV